MAKREDLKQFHRRNIAQAALKLFSENGITHTTMDEIAKTAQYSKATIYAYYESKEEIVNVLTRDSMDQLYTYVSQALAGQDGAIEKYHAVCAALARYERESPFYFDLALGEISVDIDRPGDGPLLREIFDTGERINEQVTRFLAEGVRAGVFRDDLQILQTVFFFWASLSGVIRISSRKKCYIARQMGQSQDAFLQQCFDTLLRCILK